MKKCYVCRMEKSASAFDTSTHRADGLQTACKECNSVRHAEWYQANKELVRKRALEWARIQRKVLTDFLALYFKDHFCVDCGVSNILVLEFDHVRGKKVDAIGRMLANNVSLDVLKEEISKCEVRCRNCHAIRTQMTNPQSWRKDIALNAEGNEAIVCKTV